MAATGYVDAALVEARCALESYRDSPATVLSFDEETLGDASRASPSAEAEANPVGRRHLLYRRDGTLVVAAASSPNGRRGSEAIHT